MGRKKGKGKGGGMSHNHHGPTIYKGGYRFVQDGSNWEIWRVWGRSQPELVDYGPDCSPDKTDIQALDRRVMAGDDEERGRQKALRDEQRERERQEKEGDKAAATLDPAVELALQRGLCDHWLGLPTDGLAAFQKPVNYVVTGDGVWEVRRSQLGFSVTQTAKGDIKGLPKGQLNETFLLAVPRVPWEMFAPIVAFFREVNRRHRTEALVQIFWSPDAGFSHVVPKQDVSGGKVEHVGDHDRDGTTALHVMDIHSHHTMGAFWSSTDDNDEKRFDGRAFGVIGQIDKRFPMSKWRVRAGGKFIDLPIDALIALPDGVMTTPQRNVTIADAIIAGSKDGSDGTFKVEVQTSDPFDGVTFPDAWWGQLITERKTSGAYGFYGPYGGGGSVHYPRHVEDYRSHDKRRWTRDGERNDTAARPANGQADDRPTPPQTTGGTPASGGSDQGPIAARQSLITVVGGRIMRLLHDGTMRPLDEEPGTRSYGYGGRKGGE